jgi:hypothetical protein
MTDTTDTRRNTGEYFENLYSNTLENLEEMNIILDTNELPKLNLRDTNKQVNNNY